MNALGSKKSVILDTPALAPFLDLVQLADHPGDAVVYRHFCRTALAAAKYPDGVPSASEVSREMAQAFTTRGLVRTLRELRALLPEDPSEAWSVFTEERFVDFLCAAARFEAGLSPSSRLASFPAYLDAQRKHMIAERDKSRATPVLPAPPRRPRSHIARRLTSLPFASGVSAGSLFASANGRASALRRGTAAHAAAKIGFSDILPRPAGFVALWREKAFEVFANGEWTSGRFDRVTFFRDAAGELCAEVIDFKTSRKDPGRYEGHLAEYRRAITSLTGIPPRRVTSRIVEIDPQEAS